MTTQTILVGNKGSGKSMYGARMAQMLESCYPELDFVSNMTYNTKNAKRYSDMLSALAMKIICGSTRYWMAFIDEVAIAGWEARSWMGEESSLKTYLVMLSRKVEVELIFSSQMISMMDKRLQWTGELNILCRSYHDSKMTEIRKNVNIEDPTFEEFPDFFVYTVFDEELSNQSMFTLAGDEAWGIKELYDHREIPLDAELVGQLMRNFHITTEQWEAFIEREDLQNDPNPESYEIAKKWADLASTEETRPEQVKEALGQLLEGCEIHTEKDTIYVTTMYHGDRWKQVRNALESCFPPLFYVNREINEDWAGKFVDKKTLEEISK